MEPSNPLWVPSNFLALPEEQSSLESSRVVLMPVPYDSTTSYRSGAREGPKAIIEASYNLEDYDPELEVDVAQVGIHTAPQLEPHMEGPRYMIDRVRESIANFVRGGKLVGLLGGEHSLSIGGVEATLREHPNLSVLYLDAHADMRDEYMGTRWGHASVARRISELCPLVHVGSRSFTQEEKDHIRNVGIPTFGWPPSSQGNGTLRDSSLDHPGSLGLSHVVALLSEDVYVSIDLDVLDPSVMSAVGTPEPGGMDWYQITAMLRAVSQERRIVGFDVMELSPREGPPACAYLAAKLVYKLIAYATLGQPGAGAAERADRLKMRGLDTRHSSY